jgi:hypothetical protein
MSRGPARFRQGDAEKLIRAARANGLEIAQVIVGRDGTIRLVTTRCAIEAAPGNEWDEVFDRQEEDKN